MIESDAKTLSVIGDAMSLKAVIPLTAIAVVSPVHPRLAGMKPVLLVGSSFSNSDCA
jgi:hypothetical protein